MPAVNLKEFARTRIRFDSSGQGLVEYALILLLVAVAVFLAVQGFGSRVNDTYEVINSSVANTIK
ncbi:Flp family type IVb pilin [Geomonas terrae]|uniref:Flp family type IVb pilin n=1 Tax=Geomonas terrae TaxID=2562681 RepID=A0A4S1CFK2_9BACT|nr:Flp family type IVb pilin [Geomonas terrae]